MVAGVLLVGLSPAEVKFRVFVPPERGIRRWRAMTIIGGTVKKWIIFILRNRIRKIVLWIV